MGWKGEFQRAVYDLCADDQLLLQFKDEPSVVLSSYRLSEDESSVLMQGDLDAVRALMPEGWQRGPTLDLDTFQHRTT